ncbi:MAG: hypothetical protein ACI83B_003546 [Sediminicola sp.]|jgi:hypothetical protein
MKNLTEITNIDPKAKTKEFKKGDILQREGDSKAPAIYVKKDC